MDTNLTDLYPIATILKQLPKGVNTFSLTTSFHGGVNMNHPYGLYGVNEKMAKDLFKKIDEYFTDSNKKIYDAIDKEKYGLPDYETFMAYAKQEAEDPENLTELFGRKHLFLNDMFYSKKLKYTEPQELWHIFNSFSFKYDMLNTLKETMRLPQYRPLDCDLDNPKFKALKPHVIDIEVSFHNHCTTTTSLLKTYYFKLNDETMEWLNKHNDIYDFDKLDDLAFYIDKKCVFSSFTHERFFDNIEN